MPISLGQVAGAVFAVAVGCLLAVSLGACGAGSAQSAAATARAPALTLAPVTQSALRHGADPLAGQTLYVAPNSPAAIEARRLQAQGDARDAQLLGRIAAEPTATWFASSSARVRASASALVAAAGAQTPMVVAYDIPQRDCAGGYSAGGASTPAAYSEWVAQLAAGLGTHPAVVILEPDAVPDALSGCLGAAGAQARLALLRQAVEVLGRDPRAAVYIDAGNSAWVSQLHRLAAALSSAGVAHAAGFALNVANFQTTAASVAYGRRLSRLLHHAHFVIDTGRNGNGPDTNPVDAPNWCNPPGRALGRAPSTMTGQRLVDAYLWVKAPGESDGSCRAGAPPAGQWWSQYALGLAAATP
jgi:endoglucanase